MPGDVLGDIAQEHGGRLVEHPLHGVRTGHVGGLDRVAHRFAQPVDAVLGLRLEHREEQLLLAVEVRVERPAGISGAVADDLDRGVADPGLGEYLVGGIDQPLTGLRTTASQSVRPAARRHRILLGLACGANLGTARDRIHVASGYTVHLRYTLYSNTEGSSLCRRCSTVSGVRLPGHACSSSFCGWVRWPR